MDPNANINSTIDSINQATQGLGGNLTQLPHLGSTMTTSGPVRQELAGNNDSYNTALNNLRGVGTGEGSGAEMDKKIKESTAGLEGDYIQHVQQLGDIAKRSSDTTKSLISGITAEYSNRKLEEQTQNERYVKGLQLLGLQTGTVQALPFLQAGRIREAEISGHNELMKIDAEERKALADAENAKNTQDLQLFNEKMNLYKDLQAQKSKTISDLYSAASSRQALVKGEGDLANQYAPALYKDYSTLSDAEKALYIKEAAKQLGVSPTAIVLGLASEKERLDQLELSTEQARANIANTKADTYKKSGGGGTGPGGGTAGQFAATLETVANMESTVTGKKTVLGQLQNYIKNGDYKSAYNQIANSVEQGLVGESKQRFANARTDYNVMLGLKDAIKKYTDAGGKTNVLKGSADKIARNLGALANDPQFGALATQLQREFQTYRNTMTGAAFGPKESREYAAVNPTAGKNIDLNVSVIEGALAQLQNRYQGTVNSRVPGAQYILEYANGANAGKPGGSTAQQVIESSGYDYEAIKEAYPDLTDEEILQEISEQ